MRYYIQVSSVIVLSAMTIGTFASGFDYSKEDLSGYDLQPHLQMSDESHFGRSDHALYFNMGYLFNYRFLDNSTKTLTNPAGSITYQPRKVLPDIFNGFQIGIGKEVTQHLDLQFDYLQTLESKNSTVYLGSRYDTTVKMNGVIGDVAYVINPADQFQVSLKLGAEIANYTSSFVVGGTTYYPSSNSTKIDPAFGADALLQLTKKVGIRFGTMYIFDTQNTNSNGEINIVTSLNYTL